MLFYLTQPPAFTVTQAPFLSGLPSLCSRQRRAPSPPPPEIDAQLTGSVPGRASWPLPLSHPVQVDGRIKFVTEGSLRSGNSLQGHTLRNQSRGAAPFPATACHGAGGKPRLSLRAQARPPGVSCNAGHSALGLGKLCA